MNLFDLTGKTAIVTGGINGQLGPIWCETLKEAGAKKIICLDLPLFDVTDKIPRIYDAKHVTDGFIPDILVNNAAIDNPPGSGSTFFGNFNKIMEVNIGGSVNMCEAVIPAMIMNGGGVIVNIGSIQGFIGADYRNYEEGFEKPVGYNCSKSALMQLSRSITVQYGRYNIRCVTIAFGPYDGGKLNKTFLDKFLKNVPLGRPISKESVQKTLLFACCCEEFAGQTVLVDGGYVSI